jgi:hypothetical protein
MVAISPKSISIGTAGLLCFANVVANRTIKSLLLHDWGPGLGFGHDSVHQGLHGTGARD